MLYPLKPPGWRRLAGSIYRVPNSALEKGRSDIRIPRLDELLDLRLVQTGRQVGWRKRYLRLDGEVLKRLSNPRHFYVEQTYLPCELRLNVTAGESNVFLGLETFVSLKIVLRVERRQRFKFSLVGEKQLPHQVCHLDVFCQYHIGEAHMPNCLVA